NRNGLKWNTVVCHNATVRVAACYALLGLAAAVPSMGQSQPAAAWRHIGTPAIELMLAAPATGPVNRVWFAPHGGLYARTQLGKIYQTSDFENWTPAVQPPDPPPVLETVVSRPPEPGVRAVSLAGNSARIYGLGRQLFRSQDGGRSWDSLTAYGSQAVIG